MARKQGTSCAWTSTWLVRVYLERDLQTGTRKYHNQTIHGPFREAQRFLNLKLQHRDDGRVSRAAVMSLNHDGSFSAFFTRVLIEAFGSKTESRPEASFLRCPLLCRQPLSRLSLIEWRTTMASLSPSTVNVWLSAVRGRVAAMA
jgi:hypothetical protein